MVRVQVCPKNSKMFRAVLVLSLSTIAAAQLSVAVVGDWGGQSTAPYTTAVQLSVAKTMGTVGAARKISSWWAIGDNFYEGERTLHATQSRSYPIIGSESN